VAQDTGSCPESKEVAPHCVLHRPRESANLFCGRRTYCEGRPPDKGEVGGSSPPRNASSLKSIGAYFIAKDPASSPGRGGRIGVFAQWQSLQSPLKCAVSFYRRWLVMTPKFTTGGYHRNGALSSGVWVANSASVLNS
jgi:hypothetical protein